MTIEEYWDNLTATEKGIFQRTARILLKQTFIVRDKDEDNRKLYSFISRNADFFTIYFSYMNFDVIVDRNNGVAMLQNNNAQEDNALQTNHVRLRKIDSIILCALWSLYMDRLQEGKLSRTYQVTVADLSFALEKFQYKDKPDKMTLKTSLTLLSQYNLVHVDGNIGQSDCIIVMYPSLQFALDEDSFRQLTETSTKRMMQAGNKECIAEIEQEDTEDEQSSQ